MEYIPESKTSLFLNALKKRRSHLIIVSGPPGCLKTTFINNGIQSLNLSIEYICDISTYKSKLINKNSIALTDIDDMDYYIKYKHKINKMNNLIIETRCLPYIYKGIDNAVCINLYKFNTTNLIKILSLKDHNFKLGKYFINEFDGNLHRLPFFKYTDCIPSYCIYKYLNYLFGLNYNKSEYRLEDTKLVQYVFTNTMHLIKYESLVEVYDAISLCDTRLVEFEEYCFYKVKCAKKISVKGFYSMKRSFYDTYT